MTKLARVAPSGHHQAMTATITKPRHNLLVFLALLAAASFWVMANPALGAVQWIVWKGAGVALLALWAGLNARNTDGWLITAVMVFGAVGDMLLERSQTGGALAFLAGHVTAVLLYLRHRRPHPSASQVGLAIVLFVATPVIAWLLPANRAMAFGVAVYAAGVGAMAASAWASRFPRYRVGIGAVMFLVSDLLIFSRWGPLARSPIPTLLIWPLYFGGQLLIATGVVRTLLKWKDDEDLHHRL